MACGSVAPGRPTSGPEYDLFVAAEGELWRRHGLGWTASPFEAWSAPHRHLLTQDGERSVVALDGERLAGFSAALVRGDTWLGPGALGGDRSAAAGLAGQVRRLAATSVSGQVAAASAPAVASNQLGAAAQ
jgi:hypothetical protein